MIELYKYPIYFRLYPYGLHWPTLDEDLSFQGLLKGDYGQYV